MFKPIDYLLDRITMYRLTLYYLIALVVIAMGLSQMGILHYQALAIAFSASYLTLVCLVTNKLFARIFEAPANVESSYITALILALIITPYHQNHDLLFLTAAAGLAMSSKYILAINKKHIFNPAAVAVALTAAGPGQAASWWIGSSQMLPYVIIGGLLLTRKIQRGRMVFSFLVAAVSSQIAISLLGNHNLHSTLQNSLFHSSLWFLAFVMLSEPLTSPGSSTTQTWYGIIVGALFPPQVHFLRIYSTPELALLVGNIFSYIVSPKVNLLPQLIEKSVVANNTMDFVFKLNKPFKYQPGQYMEFTLPHEQTDRRGNRRYFTLASSPTENTLRLGIKFYPNGSSFKKAMRIMSKQTMVAAGSLRGDFTLPVSPDQKLVFIAGGIGITPYRSMIKYLIDKHEQRDITLIYSEKTPGNLAYTDVFTQARQQLGANIVYTLTNDTAIPLNWTGETGFISTNMIKKAVPDYHERLFYISGPNSMVRSTEKMLHELRVPKHFIKTDFFPGYA